jgi:TonB family protein
VPFDRYPPLAHQARIAGEVHVRCVLDTSGAVTEVVSLSGHPLLAKAAAANAKLWRFERTGSDGISSEINLKYTFRLVPPGKEGTDVDSLKSNTRIDPSGNVIVTAPEACIDFVPCSAHSRSPKE